MYHVPNELSCLWEGEKLLIQMVSPYVSFVHIKNVTLGIKGHVCSFPQRVQDLYTTPPRLPNSATVVAPKSCIFVNWVTNGWASPVMMLFDRVMRNLQAIQIFLLLRIYLSIIMSWYRGVDWTKQQSNTRFSL
jgi:hypothetical protein